LLLASTALSQLKHAHQLTRLARQEPHNVILALVPKEDGQLEAPTDCEVGYFCAAPQPPATSITPRAPARKPKPSMLTGAPPQCTTGDLELPLATAEALPMRHLGGFELSGGALSQGHVVDVWIVSGQSNSVDYNFSDGQPMPDVCRPMPGRILMFNACGGWGLRFFICNVNSLLNHSQIACHACISRYSSPFAMPGTAWYCPVLY